MNETNKKKNSSVLAKLTASFGSLLISLACGSRTGGPGTDTSTDWLRACSTDAQCGSELGCECGVCTRDCSFDAQCANLGSGAVCKQTPDTCGETSVCVRENTFDEMASTEAGGADEPVEMACNPRVGCTNGGACVATNCDSPGVCRERGPAECPLVDDLLCGCDGVTYQNLCELHGAPYLAVGACEVDSDSGEAAPGLSPEDAGADAPQALLDAGGMWETSSFEDPLFLRLWTTDTTPTARVCSMDVPPMSSVPEGQSLGEYILTSGQNCDDAPTVEAEGDGLRLAFAIPWLGIAEAPLRYDLFVAYDAAGDVLRGELTWPDAEGAAIDVIWTRVTTNGSGGGLR